MASDLFGGLGNLSGALGGIVSGLAKSGFAPANDPAVKMINAQSEIADLQKQEAEILVEIGRSAFELNPSAWPQADKLILIRANMAAAEEKLNALKAEQEAEKQAQEAEEALGRCPSCGHGNPNGVNFCQECGGKLGAIFCVGCGKELTPGTRFCGTCGAKQD